MHILQYYLSFQFVLMIFVDLVVDDCTIAKYLSFGQQDEVYCKDAFPMLKVVTGCSSQAWRKGQ